MVIFYDIDSKKICMVEHDVIFPTLPANMTNEEIVKYYKEKENMLFISIPESNKPKGDIFSYDLSFDENGNLLEFIPREILKEEFDG